MVCATHNIFQITQAGAVAHHAKTRPATIEKPRAKRITCTTCDGKGCVGRCKFRKPH
jgi:hypothetical protein